MCVWEASGTDSQAGIAQPLPPSFSLGTTGSSALYRKFYRSRLCPLAEVEDKFYSKEC